MSRTKDLRKQAILRGYTVLPDGKRVSSNGKQAVCTAYIEAYNEKSGCMSESDCRAYATDKANSVFYATWERF